MHFKAFIAGMDSSGAVVVETGSYHKHAHAFTHSHEYQVLLISFLLGIEYDGRWPHPLPHRLILQLTAPAFNVLVTAELAVLTDGAIVQGS